MQILERSHKPGECELLVLGRFAGMASQVSDLISAWRAPRPVRRGGGGELAIGNPRTVDLASHFHAQLKMHFGYRTDASI